METLSALDVCEILKIKIPTLYKMIRRKEIPHFRVGRLLRFKRGDLDSWIASKRVS